MMKKITFIAVVMMVVMLEGWAVADLASSCVGHWKMNDNEPNTTVVDSSGNGNYGTAQQDTNGLHTTGKIDGALTFDGSGDFIGTLYILRNIR